MGECVYVCVCERERETARKRNTERRTLTPTRLFLEPGLAELGIVLKQTLHSSVSNLENLLGEKTYFAARWSTWGSFD